MSLKTFHVVFVTVSTLLCLFLAGWAFLLSGESSTMVTVLGSIGAVFAVVMPIYGVCFYRKAARIHI